MLCHYTTVVTSLSTNAARYPCRSRGARDGLRARPARTPGPHAKYLRAVSVRPPWPRSSPSMRARPAYGPWSSTRGARVVDVAYRELTQHFPRPGWVEHDPAEIWEAVRATLAEVGARLAGSGETVAAIGITNQRETLVALRPLERPSAAQRHRLAGPPHRAALRRAHRRGPPAARARGDGSGARSVLQRHQGRVAAPPRRSRARRRRSGPLLLHRRHLGALEPHRAAPPGPASTPPTRPTPAARCSSTRARWRGPPSCATSSECPRTRCRRCTLRRVASGRPRWPTSARPPPRSTACPSRVSWATSRRRSSARPASTPAW